MFGFGKKQNKSLLIMGTDVIEIIKSDYENDMAFYSGSVVKTKI